MEDCLLDRIVIPRFVAGRWGDEGRIAARLAGGLLWHLPSEAIGGGFLDLFLTVDHHELDGLKKLGLDEIELIR